MTANELIEYLQKFDGESKIGFLIVDLDERTAYPTKGYDLMYDEEDKSIDGPVVVLEVNKAKSLDGIIEEVESEENM